MSELIVLSVHLREPWIREYGVSGEGRVAGLRGGQSVRHLSLSLSPEDVTPLDSI